MKKFLYWAPRILSIILAAFISIFALDVFDQGYAVGELIVALLMHLLPSIAGVVLIIVAWKREQIGGWLFIAFGAAFVFIAQFELVGILAITTPFVIIGAMFLWHYHRYVKVEKDATAPAMQHDK